VQTSAFVRIVAVKRAENCQSGRLKRQHQRVHFALAMLTLRG